MPDPFINTGLKTYTSTIKNRSVALSGASQLLMAANPLRKGFLIQNDGANVAYVTWLVATAAADASGVFEIAVGAAVSFDHATGHVPTGNVFVLGTAAQPLYAQEDVGYHIGT